MVRRLSSAGLGEGEHGGIAGGDGFHLGVGQLLAADILGLAHGAVAGHDLVDEPGLGLQGLPHIGIEGAFGDVAEDRDFLVRIALAQDAAVALLDLGGLHRASR